LSSLTLYSVLAYKLKISSIYLLGYPSFEPKLTSLPSCM